MDRSSSTPGRECRGTPVCGRAGPHPGTGPPPPPTSAAKHEDHVIDPIFGLEADHQRGVAVLLQDHSSDERRFQTVCGVEANDLAKGSEGVPVQLPVVGQLAKERLDLLRVAGWLDDSRLFW